MNEQKMHDLKKMLCNELETFSDRGEITVNDLDSVHKLTDTIKNILKIEMLEYAEGYSGDDDLSMTGRSYGNSYRGQSRDSMGRYSGDSYSGRGYSRNSRDGIKDKLSDLMNEAGTERERNAIKRCMEMM